MGDCGENSGSVGRDRGKLVESLWGDPGKMCPEFVGRSCEFRGEFMACLRQVDGKVKR